MIITEQLKSLCHERAETISQGVGGFYGYKRASSLERDCNSACEESQAVRSIFQVYQNQTNIVC
jgi:hypothetical protein